MALSDAHVNILSATLSTTRDRVAKSRFTFEMADAAHLDGVLRAVRAVPGVFDAYRVTVAVDRALEPRSALRTAPECAAVSRSRRPPCAPCRGTPACWRARTRGP